MLKVLVLSAFVCCLAASQSAKRHRETKEVSPFECRGRQGYVAEGCGHYYFCLSNGTALTFRCPAGSAFNLRRLTCDQVASCISDADLKRSLRSKLKRGKKFPDKPRIRLHNPDNISEGTAVKEFRKSNLGITSYKFKRPSKRQKTSKIRMRYNPSIVSLTSEDDVQERIIPFQISRSNIDYYREVMSPPESAPKEFANREKSIMTSPSHHSFIFAHERSMPLVEISSNDESVTSEFINLGIKPKHARTYHKNHRHHRHHSIQKRQIFEEYLNKPFNFDGAASTSNDFARFPYSLPEPFQSFFRGPGDKERGNPFTMDFTQSFPTRSSEESGDVDKAATEGTQQGRRQAANSQNFTPSRIAGSSAPNSFYPPLQSVRPPRNQLPQYHRPPFQPTEFNNFEELYPYLQKKFPYAYPPESTTNGPQLAKIVDGSEKENSDASKNLPFDEKMVTMNILHGPTPMPNFKPPTMGPLLKPPSIPRPPVEIEEPKNTRRRGGRRRPTKAPKINENIVNKNTDFESSAQLRDIPLPTFKPETFNPNFPIQGINNFDNQFENLAHDEKVNVETETRKPFRSEVTTPFPSFQELPTTRPTRPPATRPPQRSRARATPPPPPPPRVQSPRPAPIQESVDYSSIENEADVRVPFGARIRSGGRKVVLHEPKPRPQEPPRRPSEPVSPPRRRPEPMMHREIPIQVMQQPSRPRSPPRQPSPQEPPRNLANSQEDRRINRNQQSTRNISPSRASSRLASPMTNQPNKDVPDNIEPRLPQVSRPNNHRLVNSRTSSRYRTNDAQKPSQLSEEMPQRIPQRNQRRPSNSAQTRRTNQQAISLEENESTRSQTSREQMRNQRRTNRFGNSKEKQESQENKSMPEPSEGITRQSRRISRQRLRQLAILKQEIEAKEQKEIAEPAQGTRASKRKRTRRPRPGNMKPTETGNEMSNTTPLHMSHVEYMEEEGQRPFPAEATTSSTTSTTAAPESTTQAGRVFTALSGGNMLNKRPRILPPRPRISS